MFLVLYFSVYIYYTYLILCYSPLLPLYIHFTRFRPLEERCNCDEVFFAPRHCFLKGPPMSN